MREVELLIGGMIVGLSLGAAAADIELRDIGAGVDIHKHN